MSGRQTPKFQIKLLTPSSGYPIKHGLRITPGLLLQSMIRHIPENNLSL
jgi:hypothetical protein